MMADLSGPVRVPINEESAAIQAAPAYDTAAARALIPVLPEIRALADSIPDQAELTAFGAAQSSREALTRLDREIRKLCAGNHKVSLIMADLKTRSGVAFRPGVSMCSQSTVKAVYVGSLLDFNPEILQSGGADMRESVVYSNNSTYAILREVYGPAPLRKWCAEAGVDPGFAEPDYPRAYTARDMFKMWTRLYQFLNSGADQANFGRYYADSLASAARVQLGSRYPIQTKAGWECGLDEGRYYEPDAVIPPEYTDGDPMNDECAINDTGVIYTEKGPYIFVIYTDHPYGIYPDYTPPHPLLGITEALLVVQQSIK